MPLADVVAEALAGLGASKPLDPLVASIASMMIAGLAQAAADGGAACEAQRKIDNKYIPCLYPALKPPAINADGSLVDPDAGPPALDGIVASHNPLDGFVVPIIAPTAPPTPPADS